MEEIKLLNYLKDYYMTRSDIKNRLREFQQLLQHLKDNEANYDIRNSEEKGIAIIGSKLDKILSRWDLPEEIDPLDFDYGGRDYQEI